MVRKRMAFCCALNRLGSQLFSERQEGNMSNHRRGLIAGAGALLITMLPVTSAAGGHGFVTSDPPLLTTNVGGGTVTPILSVGDTVDGVMFEGLPDGLGLVPDLDGDVGSKGRRGQRPASCRRRSHLGAPLQRLHRSANRAPGACGG